MRVGEPKDSYRRCSSGSVPSKTTSSSEYRDPPIARTCFFYATSNLNRRPLPTSTRIAGAETYLWAVGFLMHDEIC